MAAPAAPATPTSPPPTPTQPTFSLASLYDVRDPEFVYTIPDSVATPKPVEKPAAPLPTEPAPTPVVPPVAPVVPVAAAATPAPVPAPTPKHPTWLQRQAEALGVHPLIIDRLDSEALGSYVTEQLVAQRQEAADRSRAAAAQPVAQPVVAPQVTAPGVSAATPQAPSAAPQPQQPPAFDWGEFEETDHQGRVIGKKRYSDADIDPAVGFHIKRQADRISQLENVIAGLARGAESTREAQLQKEFDVVFDRFPQVFGTGNASTLRGKPEFQNRAMVYHAVKGMFGAMPREVLSTFDRKELIANAVVSMAKTMFGADPVAAAATPSTVNGRPAAPGVPTPQQFANGHAAVPTARKPSTKPLGPERAKEELAAWMEEQKAAGGIPASDETSLDEFLPG